MSHVLSGQLMQTIQENIKFGRSCLVFAPGKAAIREIMDQLVEFQFEAEILPLHSELTTEAQQLCFKRYPSPKVVVATNIAQASVTIPGISSVIDTGLKMRVECVDGIQGLFLHDVSCAELGQHCLEKVSGVSVVPAFQLCGSIPYALITYGVAMIKTVRPDLHEAELFEPNPNGNGYSAKLKESWTDYPRNETHRIDLVASRKYLQRNMPTYPEIRDKFQMREFQFKAPLLIPAHLPLDPTAQQSPLVNKYIYASNVPTSGAIVPYEEEWYSLTNYLTTNQYVG